MRAVLRLVIPQASEAWHVEGLARVAATRGQLQAALKALMN